MTARRPVCVGLSLVVLLVATSAGIAQEEDELFARATDNVKKIILETNKSYGEDLQAVCSADSDSLDAVINENMASLRRRGEVTGLGFFALGVRNYYTRRCKDQG